MPLALPGYPERLLRSHLDPALEQDHDVATEEMERPAVPSACDPVFAKKCVLFASSPLVLVQLFDAVVLHAKLHIQPCKRHKQTGKKKCFCWRHFMFRIHLEVTVLYGVSLYYATGNGPRLSVVPVTKRTQEKSKVEPNQFVSTRAYK